jgi:hypothetical protein
MTNRAKLMTIRAKPSGLCQEAWKKRQKKAKFSARSRGAKRMLHKKTCRKCCVDHISVARLPSRQTRSYFDQPEVGVVYSGTETAVASGL